MSKLDLPLLLLPEDRDEVEGEELKREEREEQEDKLKQKQQRKEGERVRVKEGVEVLGNQVEEIRYVSHFQLMRLVHF